MTIGAITSAAGGSINTSIARAIPSEQSGLIDRTIARLDGYLHMADFGTCALDWPLEDEWEREVAEGKLPE